MKIALIQPLLVSEEELEKQFAPLRKAGHELVYRDCRGKSDEDIIDFAGDCEVLMLANMPLSAAVVEGLPKLKMISVAFTGVDHIPMALCSEKGITVCNSQGYATQAVVEMVFGLIFAVYRKIVAADRATRNGESNADYFGTELSGKTFGVIGAGAIGANVAKTALAFGCKVIAFDTTERPELEGLGIEMRSMDAVLRESDVLSLHVPLVDSTRGLISREKLSLMKKSAVLINASRGPVVDNEALTDALLKKDIAGAGIDVYDMEPPIPADYCLMKVQENVVFTPHTAFGTTESFIKRAAIVFDNVRLWIEGTPQNLKNA
ncbi:MAG: NAD(P)-dependent oxidoreductase, partial [Spirochaetota bacterium]|nr:NAD(P)-dependent oxidoreductase [Spirochaetota bacterium]